MYIYIYTYAYTYIYIYIYIYHGILTSTLTSRTLMARNLKSI